MSDSTDYSHLPPVFTEGPWEATPDDGKEPGGEQGIWIGTHAENVTFIPGYIDHPNIRGNAYLIAAAPCMFEALADVESKIVDYEAGRINWRPDDFLLRVREALRKARGETSLAQAEAQDAS